ncbi:hypothetical protein [Streptomyces achromogenes]|uniref:hypothetical protein n=1 Tax=Streptomyces achromogenes TaxID=67255 RepID=UPI0036C73888
MAVELLTDEQAAPYVVPQGAGAGELERFFFLGDADWKKVQVKRSSSSRRR